MLYTSADLSSGKHPRSRVSRVPGAACKVVKAYQDCFYDAGFRLLPGRSGHSVVWLGGDRDVFRVIRLLGAFQWVLPDHPGIPAGHTHVGPFPRHPFHKNSECPISRHKSPMFQCRWSMRRCELCQYLCMQEIHTNPLTLCDLSQCAGLDMN